jgi:hypothetical protein
VVSGTVPALVVDMGAYVDVGDTSSPDAELHPAAVTASTATNRSGRTVCIGVRCYGGWRVKRFNEDNGPNNVNLVLGSLRGSRGRQEWSTEVVGRCGLDTTEFSTSLKAG